MTRVLGYDGAIVIVDLKDEIKVLNSYVGFYELYKRLPVHKYIETILSVPALDSDFQELVWHVIAEAFKNDMDNLDIDIVDLFLDSSIDLIDSKLRTVFPNYIDYSEYILDRWISHTTIVMKRYDYFKQPYAHPVQINRT